jgi:hypothetical protein
VVQAFHFLGKDVQVMAHVPVFIILQVWCLLHELDVYEMEARDS